MPSERTVARIDTAIAALNRSESSVAARAWLKTASKKALATSACSSRSRFLLKTVGDQIGSSMLRPINQRNRTL